MADAAESTLSIQCSPQILETACLWIIRDLAKLWLRGEDQELSGQRLNLTVSAYDVFIQ